MPGTGPTRAPPAAAPGRPRRVGGCAPPRSSPSTGSGGRSGGRSDGTPCSVGPAGAAAGGKGGGLTTSSPLAPTVREGMRAGGWVRIWEAFLDGCGQGTGGGGGGPRVSALPMTRPRKSPHHPPAPCSIHSAEGAWPEGPWLPAPPWPPPGNGGQHETGPLGRQTALAGTSRGPSRVQWRW